MFTNVVLFTFVIRYYVIIKYYKSNITLLDIQLISLFIEVNMSM